MDLVAGEAPLDPAAGALDGERPLGVYVHVPFCSARCPYCDFAIDTRAAIPHDAYADAVAGELAARAPWFSPAGHAPTLRSIYFGGGTPGLWRPDCLARIVAATRDLFAASGELEVTLEANPGEITRPLLDAFRKAGVNRLSLGLQSFRDDHLRAIGRHHSGDDARAALPLARAAGFGNVTCDLMFGLPGQTLDDFRADVDTLVGLGPDHVSAYALTIERGTPFGADVRAGRLLAPDDALQAEMYEHARTALEAGGFVQYEVSSYARPGRRSVHNGLYWSGAAYLGVGASAASFRPLADGTGVRFSNPRATDTYLRACARGQGNPAPAKVEPRTLEDLEDEALWLGLRTSDGIDRRAHAARYGADPLARGARQDAATACERAGWLVVTPEALRLTRAGFLFADEVAVRLG